MSDQPAINLAAVRYLAFEGGGARGLAYVGALQAYYHARYGSAPPGPGFKWDLDGVAGSSVGAITALMVALDYTPAQMGNLMVRDGLFAALFAERVRDGHFCAAASPLPGKTTPLAGHYGAAFKPGSKDPDDRGASLTFHCCPPAPAKAKAKDDTESSAGGKDLFSLVSGLWVVDALPDILLDYGKAVAKSAVRTTIQMARKSEEDFWDLFTENLLKAAGEDLAAAFGEAAERFDRLGLFADHLRAAGEKMGELFAEDFDPEDRNLAIVGYPFVLLVMWLITRFGPMMSPAGADEAGLEAGKRTRRRLKPKTGRSNLLYYAEAFIAVVLAQTTLQGVLLELARGTLGSAGFVGALGRGLGLGGEPPAERRQAWRALNRHCFKLVYKPLERNLGTMIATARHDGGLWHGDAMRDVLAFAILNKVAVIGKPGFADPGEVRFGLRRSSLIEAIEKAATVNAADLLDFIRLSALRRREEKPPKADNRPIDEIEAGLEPPIPSPDPKTRTLEARLNALERKLAAEALPPALESQLGADDMARLSLNEQLRAIRDWFDFSALRDVTGKDLVVTATNITSSQPVYFRESLTPDFPVIEAVRVSGGFPFLFKPTAIAYRPRRPETAWRRGDPALQARFYRLNYCGYFVDGGFLNNHPMDAFNGIAAPAPGAESAPASALFNTPQEMMAVPFGANVLGFELTNSVAEPCPFAGSFKETKSSRGIGTVLSGLSGTFYAASSTLRFLDPKIEAWKLPIRYGSLDLLDFKPDYFAVLDVHGGNYEIVYRALMGSVSAGAGAKAVDEMFGLFALRGAPRATGGRGDARKAQRAWKQALRDRKRLLELPAYRPSRIRMR